LLRGILCPGRRGRRKKPRKGNKVHSFQLWEQEGWKWPWSECRGCTVTGICLCPLPGSRHAFKVFSLCPAHPFLCP